MKDSLLNLNASWTLEGIISGQNKKYYFVFRIIFDSNQLRQLDFAYHVIKYDIDSAKRNGYLPISLGKKTENSYLYDILINRRQVNEWSYIHIQSDWIGSVNESSIIISEKSVV